MRLFVFSNVSASLGGLAGTVFFGCAGVVGTVAVREVVLLAGDAVEGRLTGAGKLTVNQPLDFSSVTIPSSAWAKTPVVIMQNETDKIHFFIR